MGAFTGQLVVVHADAVAVGVRVGEHSAQQHLVRARPDPRNHVARLDGQLLDLGVVVGRVPVKGHLAHLDEWIVRVRPHLGQVERVEPVVPGLLERHDLHLERPGGVITPPDGLEQVTGVEVAIGGDQRVGLLLGEVLDALVADEVVLDPELLTPWR